MLNLYEKMLRDLYFFQKLYNTICEYYYVGSMTENITQLNCQNILNSLGDVNISEENLSVQETLSPQRYAESRSS